MKMCSLCDMGINEMETISYLEGFHALQEGMQAAQNPYDPDRFPVDHDDWQAGYKDALALRPPAS